MYLGKRIPVRWLCFSLNICEPLDLMQQMIFLLRMHGIFAMPSYNDLKKGNPLGHRISRTVFDKSIAWGTQSTSKPDMYVLEIKASRASELLKEM